jgi:uncharacterized RDD family membrane protein YckC
MWIRLLAWLIDMVVVGLPTGAVVWLFEEAQPGAGLVFLATIAVYLIYAAGFEASRYRGTIGKLVLGLEVIDETGCQLSFSRAIGRNAAKLLSFNPLSAFTDVDFNERKRAWHDDLAKTFVVCRSVDGK